MHKRLHVIIKPAVENLKTVHQPLWIAAKISLSVPKFMIVYARLKSFLINAVFHNP